MKETTVGRKKKKKREQKEIGLPNGLCMFGLKDKTKEMMKEAQPVGGWGGGCRREEYEEEEEVIKISLKGLRQKRCELF